MSHVSSLLHTHTHTHTSLDCASYAACGQFPPRVCVSSLLFPPSLSICGFQVQMNPHWGLWVSTLKWQMMASCGSVQEKHTSMRRIHTHLRAWTLVHFHTQSNPLIHTNTHLSSRLIKRAHVSAWADEDRQRKHTSTRTNPAIWSAPQALNKINFN